MNRIGIILSVVLVFCLGCIAGHRNISVDFEPEVDMAFDAPASPASLSDRSDVELLDDGYAKIGVLTFEQIVKRCLPKGNAIQCDTIIPESEHIKTLLAEAAKRGGELVTLSKDREEFARKIEKLGDCDYMDTRVVYRYQYNTTLGRFATHRVKERYCALYKKLYGTETVVTSVGAIWRKEPELAREQLYGHDLLQAAARGNIDEMKRMFAEGVGVDTKYNGVLPVTVAAQYGHIDAVKFLLDEGASLETTDLTGTPLHGAAFGGQLEMVKFLIDRGADVNAQNPNARDFLVGITPLHEAAHGGSVEVIRELISRGAEVEAKSDVGVTPLMYAAGAGHAEAVKALAKAGADVNAKSEKSVLADAVIHVTPMMWAVAGEHPETIFELLVLGADLEEEIGEDLTVMDFSKNKVEVNKFFTEYKDGAYGFIDKRGRVVIEPRPLKMSGEFSEGLLPVESNEYYGYIDKTGEFTILPEFITARPFSEGLAVVQTLFGDYRYIDATCNYVVPGKYTFAWDFHEGLAMVRPKEGKCGFIDKNGDFVIEQKFDGGRAGFEGGVCVVKYEGKWRVIDKKGAFLGGAYDWVEEMSEGMAAFEVDDLWGFIDRKGEIAIEPRFEKVYPFSEGFAAFEQNERYGYIDKTGKVVIEPTFLKVWEFSEGLAMAQDGGRRGFIDKKGRFVIDPRYLLAESFKDGLAPVCKNDFHWGCIDKTGKFVFDTDYVKISPFSEGLALFKSKKLADNIRMLRLRASKKE